MIVNKIYRVVISEPFGLVTTETGTNSFTVEYLDHTKDTKGGEYFLFKPNIPFNMKILIKDEIMRDETLKSGKYRRLKAYKDLKVEYLVGSYRHKEIDSSDLNFLYIPKELIEKFRDINSIFDKLEFIIIGSIM